MGIIRELGFIGSSLASLCLDLGLSKAFRRFLRLVYLYCIGVIQVFAANHSDFHAGSTWFQDSL